MGLIYFSEKCAMEDLSEDGKHMFVPQNGHIFAELTTSAGSKLASCDCGGDSSLRKLQIQFVEWRKQLV